MKKPVGLYAPTGFIFIVFVSANGGVSTHPFEKFRSSLFKGLWVLRAKP